MGNKIKWLVGFVISLLGFLTLFSYFLTGLFLIVIGCLIFPPVSNKLTTRLTKRQKWLIGILMVTLLFVAIPKLEETSPSPPETSPAVSGNSRDNKKTSSTVSHSTQPGKPSEKISWHGLGEDVYSFLHFLTSNGASFKKQKFTSDNDTIFIVTGGALGCRMNFWKNNLLFNFGPNKENIAYLTFSFSPRPSVPKAEAWKVINILIPPDARLIKHYFRRPNGNEDFAEEIYVYSSERLARIPTISEALAYRESEKGTFKVHLTYDVGKPNMVSVVDISLGKPDKFSLEGFIELKS